MTEDPPAKCWIDVGASTSGDWVLGDPFLRAFYLALDFDEDKVGVAPSYPLGSNPARIVRKGEDAPADGGEDAACRDDPAFFYGGDEDNDCAHVAAKPSRCDDSDNNDGERTAREACAKTCGTCPTPLPRSCVWCAGKGGPPRDSTRRTTGRRSGRRSRDRKRRPAARSSSTRWVCGTRWRTIARRGSQT